MAPLTVSSTSQNIHSFALLGFDPGRQKCGLAVMGFDHVLYYHEVVAADSVLTQIQRLCQEFPISLIVMGDQTGAKTWQAQLATLASQCQELPDVTLVDERYSSLEARARYWQMYPARGLSRLVPEGMRTIAQPIDDIVAILLIERYLQRYSEGTR